MQSGLFCQISTTNKDIVIKSELYYITVDYDKEYSAVETMS